MAGSRPGGRKAARRRRAVEPQPCNPEMETGAAGCCLWLGRSWQGEDGRAGQQAGSMRGRLASMPPLSGAGRRPRRPAGSALASGGKCRPRPCGPSPRAARWSLRCSGDGRCRRRRCRRCHDRHRRERPRRRSLLGRPPLGAAGRRHLGSSAGRQTCGPAREGGRVPGGGGEGQRAGRPADVGSNRCRGLPPLVAPLAAQSLGREEWTPPMLTSPGCGRMA